MLSTSSAVKFDIEKANFSTYITDSIIALFIWDKDFLARSFYTVAANVFTMERKTIAQLCYGFYSQYQEAPGEYIFDLVEDYVAKHPSQKKLLYKYFERLVEIQPNKDYVLKSFGGYIKQTICSQTISEAKIMVDKGDIIGAEKLILERFRDANKVTADSVMDYLVSGPTDATGNASVLNIRSFIDPYDDTVGGFFRKEFVLIFGDTGVGKTWSMIHMSKVALLQGKNVLHITLETSDEIVWSRYKMSFTASHIKTGASKFTPVVQLPNREIKVKEFSAQNLKKKLEFLRGRKGKLWLHNPTGFTFSDLQALCNNIEVFNNAVPDIIIIDSPDQMVSEAKYREERFMEKELYERLLDFCKIRNVTLFVTSQAGRQAAKKKLTRGDDVAESYDKIRIPDTVITLSQTMEERKRNLIRFFHYKSRMAERYLLLELEQALPIGQFCVGARLWKEAEGAKEEIAALTRKIEGKDFNAKPAPSGKRFKW